MRLNKYLRVSRLIKRRTVANETCDTGRVMINDKITRTSYEVKEGDMLELQLGARSLKVCAVWVNGYAPKEKASEIYKAAS